MLDKKRCVLCGCVLNSYNKTKFCWACFDKDEDIPSNEYIEKDQEGTKNENEAQGNK